ncbi:hypothetical protein BJF90_07350 [Pseudonocardia sp. CNS-004]|nr:hypothetical protein BJF90_07350 [Pseudonocardia sp. CNS-004]
MTENTILSLGAEGALLRIDVAYQGRLWHFDTSIVTGAHPWSGTINDVLTDRHLQDFATQLRSPDLPRTATLGGDRAAQVTLHISRQQGGTGGGGGDHRRSGTIRGRPLSVPALAHLRDPGGLRRSRRHGDRRRAPARTPPAEISAVLITHLPGTAAAPRSRRPDRKR